MTSKIIISIFDSIPLWVMIMPIFLCSVILLAVFIERMVFYRKISLDYRLLTGTVIENLVSGKREKASEECSRYSGPLNQMIREIMEKWDSTLEREFVIRDISEKTIGSIEKFGGVISTIATISPMLGLLGTVTGMMKSFSGLAKIGPSARDLLAQGITEALVTTALGLLVGIPALIFYNFMVSKVDYFVREVEFIANSFNDIGKGISAD